MQVKIKLRSRRLLAAGIGCLALATVVTTVVLPTARTPARTAVRPSSTVAHAPRPTAPRPTVPRPTVPRPTAHPSKSGLIQRSQALASLLSAREAMSLPSEGSAPVSLIPASRPITGEQTVLPVLARTTGIHGIRWLRVMIPGRPNGRTGWIEQSGTVSSTTAWHIVVETARRRVIVYDAGKAVRTFNAIVGTPSTPTPLGVFFVEEVVQMPPTSPGAPYALALSARSAVFQTFDGGPGQIAIHGLENIGGVLGTDVSHGCVRLANAAMDWLVLHIASGVPVTVTS